MTSARKKPLILVYHAECIDGAASAWAVAQALDAEDTSHPSVTYIPYAHYNRATAEKNIRAALQSSAQLYFVDAAPEKSFLDELMSPDAATAAPKVGSIRILDHHKTAADDLNGYAPPAAAAHPDLDIHIESQRASAAKMIWDMVLPGTQAPDILDVIDKLDGDASGLKTKEDFAAAALADSQDIRTIGSAFNTLRGLARLTFNEMAKNGAYLVDDQDQKIDRAMANAGTVTLQLLPGTEPVQVPIVNADVKHYGRQISQRLTDLGKKTGAHVAFAWFVQKNGVVSMSIRSDGTPDAGKIAEHLRNAMGVTGGGHAGAAAVHFASLAEFVTHMRLDSTPKPGAAPRSAPGLIA